MNKAATAFWNDIKGNVKYAILMAVLGGVTAGALLLVKGLSVWREAVLLLLFLIIFGWAVAASWSLHRRERLPVSPLLDPWPNLFTPLQLESLGLAKELSSFLRKLGPEPTIHPELKKDNTQAGMVKALVEMYDRQSEWEPRFQNGYARDFKDRVNKTIQTFAIEGLYDAKLNALANGVISDESVRNIREGLIRLAFRVDDPPQGVSDLKSEYQMIQAIEAEEYRKAMQYPGFCEAVDRVCERVEFNQGD